MHSTVVSQKEQSGKGVRADDRSQHNTQKEQYVECWRYFARRRNQHHICRIHIST